MKLYKNIPELANPNDTLLHKWGIYSGSFDDLNLDLFWKESLKALPNLS